MTISNQPKIGRWKIKNKNSGIFMKQSEFCFIFKDWGNKLASRASPKSMAASSATGPVVINITAPNIDQVWNILLFQNALERKSILQHFIFPGSLPRADGDAALAIKLQVFRIGQVFQIH